LFESIIHLREENLNFLKQIKLEIDLHHEFNLNDAVEFDNNAKTLEGIKTKIVTKYTEDLAYLMKRPIMHGHRIKKLMKKPVSSTYGKQIYYSPIFGA
jgi:hypothetical protein